MLVMSPARNPEPHSRFNPRSLPQTRSLRDLHTPPPSLKSSAPDKLRRRLLQVNGPYVVPEVSPPTHSIGEPSRLELVQTPYVSSQSPTSSTPLPLSIAAATRPSSDAAVSPAISQGAQRRRHPESPSSPDGVANQRSRRPVTDHAMPFPDGELIRGLRNPPIDRRKAHRYCSDFGLSRDGFKPPPVARPLPSPPVPDNSSLASTPLAMYAESETDSDTSSLDNPLDFSFPQPPSIDESLRVRRMRSSPMFSSEETDAVKVYLRKRWGGLHPSGLGGSPGEEDHWGAAGNVKSNSGRPSDRDHGLDLKRPIHRIIATQSSPHALFEGERAPLTPSTAKERNAPTSTASALPSRRTDTARKRSTTTHTPKDVKLHAASPSLSQTRSISSARKEANPLPRSASRTPITSPSQTSIRLPLELSEHLDRLDLSIEKLKAHEPQSRRGVVAVPWEYQVQPKPQALLPLSPPSLANAGRRKPVHRSYVSVPLAGLGLANITDRPHESLRTLGAPFNHRSTRSQPAIRVAVQHQEQPMPKSFIDITPEQEIRHKSSRMRVRKLLARASIGVLGWGKNLARKKSTSK